MSVKWNDMCSIQPPDRSYHSQGLHPGQRAGVAPNLPRRPRLLRLLKWEVLQKKREEIKDRTIRRLSLCYIHSGSQGRGSTWMLMIRCRSPLVTAWPTSSACSLWIKRFSSERSKWHRFSSARKSSVTSHWVDDGRIKASITVLHVCSTLDTEIWVVTLLQPGRHFAVHARVGWRQRSWGSSRIRPSCRALLRWTHTSSCCQTS